MPPPARSNPTTEPPRWSLEVVRGRRPGQVFPLQGREFLLGSAPIPPALGIDLAGQEGPTTRRIEPQHAAVVLASPIAATIRDLESECGTFVNRRRVLPGQTSPLHHGDEIQVGSVVLRFVRTGEPQTNGANTNFVYALEDGPTCRTWDDFLVVSSQRWEALSADLASGKIETFVAGIGRGDLRPRSALGSTADDRLDAWLSSLPTTRTFAPELDVHPARIVLTVVPGGGMVQRTIQVSNVGHRLLRCAARVEPPDLPWLQLAPPFADQPFTAVEAVTLSVEVTIPELLPVPLVGLVVIEGNGGTAQVEVIVEARDESDSDEVPPENPPPPPLADEIARVSPRVFVLNAAVALFAARLLFGLAGPDLVDVTLLFALLGGLNGAGLAARRGGPREAGPGGFAGACVGALAAALVVAASRAFEPAMLSGDGPVGGAVACLVWATVGAGGAAVVRWLGTRGDQP